MVRHIVEIGFYRLLVRAKPENNLNFGGSTVQIAIVTVAKTVPTSPKGR